MHGFTDSTCTTKSYHQNWDYDDVSVGSASGSNYQVSMPATALKLLVTTTTAETWMEALYSNTIDLTVGTEYSSSSTTQYYGLWNVSGTTLKMASTSSSAYPSTVLSIPYTK